MSRILVVEDEEMVAEVVDRYLRRDGHDVRVVREGHAALPAVDDFAPELVVLDLMLPGVDGIEICRTLRERSDVPVIILSARREEVDKLAGFGVGADDYVTKPFSPRELAARIQTVLRRVSGDDRAQPDVLRFSDLVIDVRARSVEREEQPIDLTAREFDLLGFLAGHARQVFTREQILEGVWGYEFTGDDTTVTVHVRRVREKIEADPSRPKHIKTVWGVGYKFEP